MGKNQSKLMHSMSLNFNKRVEAKKDPAEISLMRVHSNSLESVSTVRSGDTKPHPLSLAHSCSTDDIQNANSSLTNQDTASKSHDTSIDSLNLCNSCEGDSPKARGFTQSLPTEIERKISIGSKDAQTKETKRRDLDCFSDNFITTQEHSQTELKYADENSWSPMTTDSVLTRVNTSPTQESSFQLPSIPDSMLQKLSPEEWSMFINFVCASLGNTLHSSIINEKLRPSLLKENANQIDSVHHTSKQVKVSDGQRANSSREGRHTHKKKKNRQDCEDSDDGCARSRPQCGERPLSLPSLHNLTANHQELIERLQVVRQEVGSEVEEERRSRSKSQDDWCCHVHCHHGEQFQLSRNYRQHHHRCSHRSTRRRRPRERSGHVDVSLDDNCPGLPQNRVTRRLRHHHAHQQKQHTVCEQCCQERLDSSGNSSSSHKRRSAKHHRQIQCATGEIFVADGLDASPESKSAGEEEGEVGQIQSSMTLQDMKAVTSDFLKGTNDLDESVIQDLKMQFLLGMEEQRRHNATIATTKQGGHRNLRLDGTQPCLSRNRPREKSSIRMTTSTNKVAPLWSQLAFPTEPRTGQDSPRTDMAVINLDLNSSTMRKPLHPSDLSIAVRENHPHVHVHHIIHHSQP